MTARELIALLQQVRPDTEVVTVGSDHSYVPVATLGPTRAEVSGSGRRRHLSEFWGRDNMHDATNVVIDVVVVV
jgi:hypothetical protein